jgi:hypothetical protein
MAKHDGSVNLKRQITTLGRTSTRGRGGGRSGGRGGHDRRIPSPGQSTANRERAKRIQRSIGSVNLNQQGPAPGQAGVRGVE